MATSHHYFVPFRPTMGLLTTVAELPHNYKMRYIKTESPLDLSVKTPALTLAPMTPPSTPSPTLLPLRKRRREDSNKPVASELVAETKINQEPAAKKVAVAAETVVLEQPSAQPNTDEGTTIVSDTDFENVPPKEKTPKKPIKVTTAPKTAKAEHPPRERKNKAVRKLKFDEYKSSPVSGTIIRLLDEISADDDVVMESGDIDPEYNIVEVTDEVKAEIATIPNVIGGYACKLCRIEFDDVFGLARHRCSCIVLLEYRCPECGKRFNCPANLASHRRWHKPKDEVLKKKEPCDNEQQFPCAECGKTFKRQAYLRKHLLTHRPKTKPSTTEDQSAAAKQSECSGSYRSENSNSGDFISSDRRSEDDAESQASSYSATAAASVPPPTTFRMFDAAFTEDENMAAAALAHLRNGPSVIRHTTAMSV